MPGAFSVFLDSLNEKPASAAEAATPIKATVKKPVRKTAAKRASARKTAA